MMPQGMEWIVIAVVLFLLFGASRLPQLAKSLGATRKAFKEGMREAEQEEALETEKRREILPTPAAPQISAMTDEDLLAEMRRRAEVKQSYFSADKNRISRGGKFFCEGLPSF